MSHHRHLPLRIAKAEGLTRVTVSTEQVKEANLQTLGEQLFALVDGLDGSRLELDMEAVDYLTSMALGKFVELYKRVRDRGGRLVLANLTAPVYEIFEVTKLHRLLDIRQAADADNDSEGLIPLAS